MAGAIINPRVHNPARPTARLRVRQQIILKRMGWVEPPPEAPELPEALPAPVVPVPQLPQLPVPKDDGPVPREEPPPQQLPPSQEEKPEHQPTQQQPQQEPKPDDRPTPPGSVSTLIHVTAVTLSVS